MSDPIPRSHPTDFLDLCDRAVELLHSVPDLPLEERAARLREARDAMEQVDQATKELDMGRPHFAQEQAELVSAASALQALELDHGGPHVRKYVERAIAAIRNVAAT